MNEERAQIVVVRLWSLDSTDKITWLHTLYVCLYRPFCTFLTGHRGYDSQKKFATIDQWACYPKTTIDIDLCLSSDTNVHYTSQFTPLISRQNPMSVTCSLDKKLGFTPQHFHIVKIIYPRYFIKQIRPHPTQSHVTRPLFSFEWVAGKKGLVQ